MVLGHRRLLVLVSCAVVAVALAFAPAHAAQSHQDGGESQELADSLASFFGPRAAPGTAVNPRAFAAAASVADDVPTIDSTPWKELGPYSYFPDDRRYLSQDSNSGSGSGYNTGRITGIGVAPNGDVYAAGAGGGVWRSTDTAHQQWTPVFDTQDTTAEGTLAILPSSDGNPSHYTVYAGTGEPTINLDSYAGIGILASTDHGASWHRVGGDELTGAATYKIVAEGDVLLAATSHGLYRKAPTDPTWQKVIGGPDANTGTPNAQVLNLISDVAVRPGTGGQEVVAVRGWRAGATTNGLYVSYDAGRTFTGPLAPQGYVPQTAQGRGSIAYSPDGSKLYVMVEDPVAFNHTGGGTNLEGIYLSTRDVRGPFNQIASPSVLMNSGSAQKPEPSGRGTSPASRPGTTSSWSSTPRTAATCTSASRRSTRPRTPARRGTPPRRTGTSPSPVSTPPPRTSAAARTRPTPTSTPRRSRTAPCGSATTAASSRGRRVCTPPAARGPTTTATSARCSTTTPTPGWIRPPGRPCSGAACRTMGRRS